MRVVSRMDGAPVVVIACTQVSDAMMAALLIIIYSLSVDAFFFIYQADRVAVDELGFSP